MIVYDIQNLTKRYPNQAQPANKGINLQIREGEIFGLLGDNGAGKSTLVRQMVNLLQPTSGSISLFGQPIGHNPRFVPTQIGYMPQDADALNMLTVGEALYFTAHLRGLNRYDAQQERDSLLALWQMEGLRDQYNLRLSGGQRRLLRLAVAMAGLLPVLILDEPTNDLAPQRRQMVWDILRQVNVERNTTILFITHDAIEAEKIIERVGILREGELVAVGRPRDLKAQIEQKLRLEIFCSPQYTPTLATSKSSREVQPGHWLTWINRDEAGQILTQMDMSQIDDLRLYSATLEDLYVHYINQNSV